MTKILIPVDGSDIYVRVVAAVVERSNWYKTPPAIHLLNIQHSVHRDVSQFVNHEALEKFHREEGLKALAGARAALELDGLKPTLHVVIDDQPAAAIAHFAREHAFDEVYLGTHGYGALSSLLHGSTAADLIHRLELPVTLIK